jgi:hypothetical protein
MAGPTVAQARSVLANLFLASFLVVAGGILFLLYGPTRKGRPLVTMPRASLAKIPLHELPRAMNPTMPPAPTHTAVVEQRISAHLIPQPPPPPAAPRPARRAAPPRPAMIAAPPPRPHGFAPVVNHRGPLPPRGSRIARGTGAPPRMPADTVPVNTDFATGEHTHLDEHRTYRRG